MSLYVGLFSPKKRYRFAINKQMSTPIKLFKTTKNYKRKKHENGYKQRWVISV